MKRIEGLLDAGQDFIALFSFLDLLNGLDQHLRLPGGVHLEQAPELRRHRELGTLTEAAAQRIRASCWSSASC